MPGKSFPDKIKFRMKRKSQKEINLAVEILKSYGAKKVFVFGSYAKGKERKGSDIDLAVTGLPPEKFFKALAELIFTLKKEVHLVDLDYPSPFATYLKTKGEMIGVG